MPPLWAVEAGRMGETYLLACVSEWLTLSRHLRHSSGHHPHHWIGGLDRSSLLGLMTHGSTVLFTLWGRAGPRASFHPPRRLPFCSTQGGKFSPDVTSNKRKAAGIEGGIRTIFCVTLRPASSWHLSIFLLFCSLWWALVSSRLTGPFTFTAKQLFVPIQCCAFSLLANILNPSEMLYGSTFSPNTVKFKNLKRSQNT